MSLSELPIVVLDGCDNNNDDGDGDDDDDDDDDDGVLDDDDGDDDDDDDGASDALMGNVDDGTDTSDDKTSVVLPSFLRRWLTCVHSEEETGGDAGGVADDNDDDDDAADASSDGDGAGVVGVDVVVVGAVFVAVVAVAVVVVVVVVDCCVFSTITGVFVVVVCVPDVVAGFPVLSDNLCLSFFDDCCPVGCCLDCCLVARGCCCSLSAISRMEKRGLARCLSKFFWINDKMEMFDLYMSRVTEIHDMRAESGQ